ncbi:SAM-dependent methyltransferase [Dactylosporangium darangshiense]|uniref:SAM-dependent methyltransferase n=1 Tax=Dactylosporangium darangshiense TaxID=579108 RepID=A0ABP8DUP5_9ACTN
MAAQRRAENTPAAVAMIDTSTPHPARRYNYWLGGKDHFAADRESGDAIAAVFPHVREAALQNRWFLQRAVAYLAGQAGIRQFLDVGVGIPLSPNTHEIAQDFAPDCRVVYVDNDPIVLTHARALLTSDPAGATAYVEADLRDPAAILDDPGVHHTIDLSQPVGLLLVAVLHFLDDDEATRAVAELRAALAPGSYIVLSHGTTDYVSVETAARIPALQQDNEVRFQPRSREQVAGFVAGLYAVDPAPPAPGTVAPLVPIDRSGPQLVSVVRWRPDRSAHDLPRDEDVACYGVVAGMPDGATRPAGAMPAASPVASTDVTSRDANHEPGRG